MENLVDEHADPVDDLLEEGDETVGREARLVVVAVFAARIVVIHTAGVILVAACVFDKQEVEQFCDLTEVLIAAGALVEVFLQQLESRVVVL